MNRFLGEFVATIFWGTVAIFAVAVVALVHHLRKHLLRRVNQQLDEILADSPIEKDGRFFKSL